jgi:hypothetical protein
MQLEKQCLPSESKICLSNPEKIRDNNRSLSFFGQERFGGNLGTLPMEQ